MIIDETKLVRISLLCTALVIFMLSLQEAGAGHFINTGTTNIWRREGSATLLPDGRVLSAGGLGTGSGSSTAGIYDPFSGNEISTPSMQNVHFIHTATLLPTGKVLIVAGFTPACELFNPTDETWTNTSPLPNSNQKHTATLLPNGQVLVTGGETGNGINAYSNCFLFNPATEGWTETGAMHEARRRHTTTLLPNGKILAAGGWGKASPNFLPTISEHYDPATETWTISGSLNMARRFHTATLLPNGKVLVTGGEGTTGVSTASAELYDPSTELWTVTGQMSTGRIYHAASLLPSGKVLITGGQLSQNSILPYLTAEIYDPATEKWTLASPMTSRKYQHDSTLLLNKQVLVGSDLYIEPSEFFVTNFIQTANGAFQFGFTNIPGSICNVLIATNASLPLSNWTTLGAAIEISPGQFQFTDAQATNSPQRFYRVRAN